MSQTEKKPNQQNDFQPDVYTKDIYTEAFYNDVLNGLSQQQKSIPCKWFYDALGSQLFEAITKTPEYYPTRVETRLLKQVVLDLAVAIPQLSVVIEPGSGASVKTRILLDALTGLDTYIPMDISADFLAQIAQQLHKDYPQMNIVPLVDDFTQVKTPLNMLQDGPRLVFFPGSTIGNFSPIEAQALLNRFHHLAGDGGWLLIGIDSTQQKDQLLAAYNDSAGVTAQFNQNLLVRANRELHTNFVINHFKHDAQFNQVDGRVEMRLLSQQAQTVQLANHTFYFAAGESLLTEHCYKYTQTKFLALANQCNWQLHQLWQDQQESAFTLFLLKSNV